MATRMKGIFKGFKYITQIFVYKEQEMEIGYPTDVRHVAHIGWDNTSLNGPSWMDDFKTASDFSSRSLSNFGESRDTSWASQDFDQSRGFTPPSGNYSEYSVPEIPKAPKKTKQKKCKDPSHSSSKRGSSSSSRSSKKRTASYSTTIEEDDEMQTRIQMA